MEFIKNMINFIYESPTAFNATENIKNTLLKNGFERLLEKDSWELKEKGKYFVTKHDSSLIAFKVGEDIKNNGFNLIGAHTDAPSFKIKGSRAIIDSDTYIKLNTEVYGGPILNTWFDRPLGIAGKVFLKGENSLNPIEKNININKPIVLIPNIAIHMNREVNKGMEYNPAKNTLPIVGLVTKTLEKNDYILEIIKDELNIKKEDILEFELFLYAYEKGLVMGLNNEFVLSSRLDDLSMIYTGLEGLLNSKNSKATQVLVCFDHEEIGSMTAEGANSNLLNNILERILIGTGDRETENMYRAISNSLMISADLAHAHHPNFPEKTDITLKPLMGKGPVIKYSAGRKYATNGYIASVIKSICEENNIETQPYVNKSDIAGGSTIGPAIQSKLNIPVIDIGTAVFGMHSIMETGSVKDFESILEIFKKFYELKK